MPPFAYTPALEIDPKIIDGIPSNLTQGIEVELIRTIGVQLNFTPTFLNHAREQIGQIWQNGSGTGMFGAVLSGESLIAIGNIKTNPFLHETFDFTVQYSEVIAIIDHFMCVGCIKNITFRIQLSG